MFFFLKVWEDAFESFSKMSQDIIVQVWKDWGLSLKNQIEKVTLKKYFKLIFAFWIQVKGFLKDSTERKQNHFVFSLVSGSHLLWFRLGEVL